MNIQPKGYEAIRQRMEELQSKMQAYNSRPPGLSPSSGPPKPLPLPGSFATTLDGAIGESSLAPVDPMKEGLNVSPQADLRALATQTAGRYGIDPQLFESLIEQESSFNPRDVSSKGAMGLTQLMPSTAKSLGVTDPLNPAQNLDGGARYLQGMLRQFGGDTRLALAAYNAGPGAVQRHGGVPPFRETQEYVDKILARAGELRKR